jgi:hypothetical protein
LNVPEKTSDQTDESGNPVGGKPEKKADKVSNSFKAWNTNP